MTTYFKGFEAKYTGRVVALHGAAWREVEMLEGPDKGETRLVRVAVPPYAERKAMRDATLAIGRTK